MNYLKRAIVASLLALALFATACGGSDASSTLASTTDEATSSAATSSEAVTAVPTAAAVVTEEPSTAVVATELPAAAPTTEATTGVAQPTAVQTTAVQTTAVQSTAAASDSALSCNDTAALFVTAGSANPSLADPKVSASCSGDMITITSNGIPDYTYIETSPGDPAAQNLTFVMPATPTAATEYTAVPYIGPLGVALNGVPIYGPTEGQGGDVLSLGGGLSECGSHNGPTGFHIHLFGTSTTTDCIYSPDEAASAPQLLGYAIDGYPIYTGNDQYTSSWTLTDESLFATDTWEAHSYVEGSGDLDQCNGLTDENGNYAYYTTDTFPYVIGCFAGEVDLTGSGAGGGGFGAPGGNDQGPPTGGEGAAPAGGQAPGGAAGGTADFTEAAAALGVAVEELEAALGGPPPDFDAAATVLGVTVEELEALLPAPPA